MYQFSALDVHVYYTDLLVGYHEKPDWTLLGQKTSGKDPDHVGYPPLPGTRNPLWLRAWDALKQPHDRLTPFVFSFSVAFRSKISKMNKKRSYTNIYIIAGETAPWGNWSIIRECQSSPISMKVAPSNVIFTKYLKKLTKTIT